MDRRGRSSEGKGARPDSLCLGGLGHHLVSVSSEDASRVLSELKLFWSVGAVGPAGQHFLVDREVAAVAFAVIGGDVEPSRRVLFPQVRSSASALVRGTLSLLLPLRCLHGRRWRCVVWGEPPRVISVALSSRSSLSILLVQ